MGEQVAAGHFYIFYSAHDVFETDRLLADGSDEKNSMRAGREASLTGYIEDFYEKSEIFADKKIFISDEKLLQMCEHQGNSF